MASGKAMEQAMPWPPHPAPRARSCPPAALRRWLPLLAWLPHYSTQWLRMDLVAGLSVALTVIPQALAYAEVAGLPPQYGLYSAFVGCFVYVFLGTSRDVTLGPTAIMSLLVSSYTFREPAYAVLLAFLSGCVQLAMRFLCLGFLLDFVSCPVIKGFTSAAAVTIGVGQIKNLLGLQRVPRQFFLQLYHTFRSLGETRVGDAVLGLVCLLLLLLLRLMRAHMPPVPPNTPPGVRLSLGLVWTATTARNALVVSGAALMAYSCDVAGYRPFVLTGEIVQGLPAVRVPPFSLTTANGTVSFSQMVQDMGAGLAVVPLMGLLESIAVAKAFASQNHYRIDANQELLSIGEAASGASPPRGVGPMVVMPVREVLARLVSSVFTRSATSACSPCRAPSLPVTLSRLVRRPDQRPGLLLLLLPGHRQLRAAALAAVIIMAVAPLLDAGIARTLWRVRRLDLLPLSVTFLLCFWEVQYGILAGTLVSLLILLRSVARPGMQVSEWPVLVVQPAGGLHFPAIEALREAVESRALGASPPRSAVLECSHVCSLDYTVVLGLRELLEDFRRRDLTLVLVGLQEPVRRVLLSADLRAPHFPSLQEAERYLSQEPGTQPHSFSHDSVPEPLLRC
ncbi:sodium-independent sulfate anion transporter [Eptesicus fuscus]|uniref:sodium-independent sulfate anion transporter n=1 Tax=Eptesicus fuscus TaxID=29078 RepID=UPI0024048261|nr:sodium-independent sulfate anion transporter [Eptesicus fuscus]